MFINDEEYQRRIRTEENLLNRLPQDHQISGDVSIPAIPSFDLEDILSISNESTTQEPKKKSLSQNRLQRILNADPSYAGRGTKQLHRDTQASIGISAGILGTTKAARIGDVSIRGAHAYERGYTTPTDVYDPGKSPKEELQAKIIEGHTIVVDKCFSRLLKSLDLLDDDKLQKVQKAGELSQIAKNLSGIIGHAAQATQDHVDIQEKSVHFHIMRPEQATDADYQTIEVSSAKEEIREQAWREKLD